jgi:hypothetical protein
MLIGKAELREALKPNSEIRIRASRSSAFRGEIQGPGELGFSNEGFSLPQGEPAIRMRRMKLNSFISMAFAVSCLCCLGAADGNNTLSDAEKAAGWKLLFNGKDFTGWHNFKKEGVQPGWQAKDGALVCVDPHNAGDIVTTEKFGAFELQLDYNISEGGNSGIMYHVSDEGGAVWATGPEFQLEDNAKAADPVRCGWLYALYQPPTDPNTGKPLDATKPAGQWNHVRLLITPQKCEHEINGVKYFDYVLGSEDFNKRVAASKFANMPGFAKSISGYIALQGDHGQVSFRNIKVRNLEAGK